MTSLGHWTSGEEGGASLTPLPQGSIGKGQPGGGAPVGHLSGRPRDEGLGRPRGPQAQARGSGMRGGRREGEPGGEQRPP